MLTSTFISISALALPYLKFNAIIGSSWKLCYTAIALTQLHKKYALRYLSKYSIQSAQKQKELNP
jgi:hypothetical protein